MASHTPDDDSGQHVPAVGTHDSFNRIFAHAPQEEQETAPQPKVSMMPDWLAETPKPSEPHLSSPGSESEYADIFAVDQDHSDDDLHQWVMDNVLGGEGATTLDSTSSYQSFSPSKPRSGLIRIVMSLMSVLLLVGLGFGIWAWVHPSNDSTYTALPDFVEVTRVTPASVLNNTVPYGYSDKPWEHSVDRNDSVTWTSSGVVVLSTVKSKTLVDVLDPATGQVTYSERFNEPVDQIFDIGTDSKIGIALVHANNVTMLKGSEAQTQRLPAGSVITRAGAGLIASKGTMTRALVDGSLIQTEAPNNRMKLISVTSTSAVYADGTGLIEKSNHNGTLDRLSLQLPASAATLGRWVGVLHNTSVTAWATADGAILATHNLATGRLVSRIEVDAETAARGVWLVGSGARVGSVGSIVVDGVNGDIVSYGSDVDVTKIYGHWVGAKLEEQAVVLSGQRGFLMSQDLLGADAMAIIFRDSKTVRGYRAK